MINEECVSCMCNLVVSLWVAINKYTFYLTQAVFVIFITAHMHYRYKVKGSMATIFLLKFIFSIFKMCTITLIGNRNLKVIRWFISVVYITKFLFKFTLFFFQPHNVMGPMSQSYSHSQQGQWTQDPWRCLGEQWTGSNSDIFLFIFDQVPGGRIQNRISHVSVTHTRQ